MGAAPWVLADVRLDIDDVLARIPADAPLLVVNVDAHGDFIDERPGPLALTRAGRPILFTLRHAWGGRRGDRGGGRRARPPYEPRPG